MAKIGAHPETFIQEYLTDVGDSRDMNVNGSSTPVPFRWINNSTKPALIVGFDINIVDQNIDLDKFAGISGDLSNGIIIRALRADDSVRFAFNNGFAVVRNTDFSHLGIVTINVGLITAPDQMSVNWEFARKHGNSPFILLPNEKFEVIVQDDLSGLNVFMWMVEGHY